MKRRDFLKNAGLGIAAIAMQGCQGFSQKQAAAKTQPNILFIFSDDHAYQAISAYGSRLAEVAPTPNIDRLAKEGMLFEKCYVTNSICSPSRAVILTGKHSHLNGVLHNREVNFDGSQQTFPKLLRKAGYQTAIVGKWHLETEPTGFDYWEILPGQGHYYNPPMKKAGQNVKHTGYVTDIVTDLGIDWLSTKRDKTKPFMMMLQHKAAHRKWEPNLKHLHLFDNVTIPEPKNLFDDYSTRTTAAKIQNMTISKTMNGQDLKFVTPKDLNDQQRKVWEKAYAPKNQAFENANLTGDDLVRWKYQRYMKDYLRCIKSVDENIGKVLDYLETSGLAKNTVVIYSSDQGFYLGEHGWFDKRFMYKESFRTPFLVRWPGVTKPGSTNNDMTQNLDFAQTFLDIAGAEQPADMQGISLKPLMQGKRPKDWRKSLYYHYYQYDAGRGHNVSRHEGVATKRYKLIHFYDHNEWELYDLKKDPSEMKNQYENPKYASLVEQLKEELLRLRELYKVPENQPPESK